MIYSLEVSTKAGDLMFWELDSQSDDKGELVRLAEEHLMKGHAVRITEEE